MTDFNRKDCDVTGLSIFDQVSRNWDEIVRWILSVKGCLNADVGVNAQFGIVGFIGFIYGGRGLRVSVEKGIRIEHDESVRVEC